MCFNPFISLSTFVIEWIIFWIILLLNPKSRFHQVSAIIVLFLALYQGGEFMLCTTGDDQVWARVAYVSATFLPALGLHLTYVLLRKKTPYFLIYSLPVLFSLIIIFTPDIINGAQCHTLFVEFSYGNKIITTLHSLYYVLFLMFISIVLLQKYTQTKTIQRKVYLAFLGSMILLVAPTLAIVLLFPSVTNQFGSILCHFAVLFAIALLYIIHRFSSFHNNRLKFHNY